MHTEGPWSVVASLPGGAFIVAGKDGAEVADVLGDNGLPAAANARLIAAAPAMLEALQQMLTDPPATLDEPDPDHEVIKKMREIATAAVAKATEPRP